MRPGASYLLLFILLSTLGLSAQSKKLDSLLNVLSTEKEDTFKAKTLVEVSSIMIMRDPEKGHEYLNQLRQLSAQLKFNKGLMDAERNEAVYYYVKGDYPKAVELGLSALKLAQTAKDSQRWSKALNNLGNFYAAQGKYKEATEYQLNAAKMKEEMGDKKGAAISYGNLGAMAHEQGQFTKALEYQLMALRVREEMKDSSGIGTCYTNLGDVYCSMKNFRKAVESHLLCLRVAKDIGDLHNECEAWNHLGGTYFYMKNLDSARLCYIEGRKLAVQMGDKKNQASATAGIGDIFNEKALYDSALVYTEMARKMEEEIGFQYGLVTSYHNLGSMYTYKNNYPLAKKYLEQAIELGRTVGMTDMVALSYKNLAEVYARTKDYQKAFECQQHFLELNDTLLNEESQRQMNEMQGKYDSDKKDNEIKLLNKDNELKQADLDRQHIVSYSVGAGLLLALLLAFFIFRGYRQKQRANVEITQQKEIIEVKNKEILDSIHYAQRIQRALLASDGLLRKYFAEHFVLYKPKDIVSGDFYWANTAGGKLMMITADCTGHGVPGAFMSLLNISLLNEVVIEKNLTQPSLVLDQVREQIVKVLNPEGTEEQSRDGMDCVLCCYDMEGMKLDFACANIPLWLVRDGKIEEFAPDKMPVGMQAGEVAKPFTHKSIALKKGDVIYTFSDGYADQFGGPQGKKFKYRKVQELVLAHASRPMSEQKKIIEDTIEEWKGNLEQVDDILVIGVRV